MKLGNKIPTNLYEHIVDSMPYGILVADTKGEFILWNKVSYAMFSENLRTSKQENWVSDWGVFEIDKVTPFKAEAVPLTRALKGETVEGVKMFIKNSKSEKALFIKVNGYPLMDKHGKLEAGIVMVEDITKEQTMYDTIMTKFDEIQKYLKDER